MHKLLIPIDGSNGSLQAVRHVLKLAKLNCPLEIHLLHVQPPVNGWEVKHFLRDSEIADHFAAQAEQATQAARELLDQAQLDYTLHVETGVIAETIAAFAHQRDCDQIIMGARGMGALEGLLLGSTSTKVLHLVRVPVTLVK